MQTNGRNHPWRVLGILGVAFGVALLFSAWSWQLPGTDGASPSVEQEPVTVTVTKDTLSLSSTSLSSGSHTFEVTNEGSEAHGFAINGPVKVGLEGKVAAGKMKSLQVSLEPGTYVAYCPMEGHREKESVEFTVER